MKAGISTASLFKRMETEQASIAINEMGAEVQEIFFSTFYEYRPEFSLALAPALGKGRVCSVHAQSLDFENHLFSPSRRVCGDGYYWLDQLMRSANALGCNKYTFHGLVRIHGGRAIYADKLREASDFCARYGVRLCLENVAWSLYDKPGIFKELKREIPSLGGVFDIKQARRSGYPYAMYIEDMAGSIAHAHLSDVSEDGAVCLPGKGVYDFESILKRMRDCGFDGEVLIEVYNENYGEVRELKQSLEFLNEIIYKIT